MRGGEWTGGREKRQSDGWKEVQGGRRGRGSGRGRREEGSGGEGKGRGWWVKGGGED